MKTIAVIGSGSWGMALATHLARIGHTVKVWSFSKEESEFMKQTKTCKFIDNLILPESIFYSTSFEEVIKDSDIILHVTPSKFVRNVIKQYKQYVTNQPVILCSKGFEKETLYTLSDVAQEEMPDKKIGVLSGPSHAEEVAMEIPTAIVIAAKCEDVRLQIQDAFMNENMRIYTSEDIKGVELGGALKNIIAFCAGIAAEIGMGDNTFAALITRGLVEIGRLGEAMGGKHDTFYGLSGLGDLIVTCLSEHSRNRRAGKLIGKGKTIEETKQEIGMTIESIDNIEVAYALCNKYKICMPIVDSVYQILYNNLKPEEAVKQLMTREKKFE